MNSSDAFQFELEISADDATDEEVDRMTRDLLAEIRETAADAAALARPHLAPQGLKGEPVTIGSRRLVVLPAILPKLIELVQAWVACRKGRTVRFKGRVLTLKVHRKTCSTFSPT